MTARILPFARAEHATRTELVTISDHSLAHDRVDSILATLAEAPGVVIRDRRGR